MKINYAIIKKLGLGLGILYTTNFLYHQEELVDLKRDQNFLKYEQAISKEDLEQKIDEGTSKNYKERFIGPWIKDHWGDNIQNPEYKGQAEWVIVTKDTIGYKLWLLEKNCLEEKFYTNRRMSNNLDEKVNNHKRRRFTVF
ncbi:MAG: hypothetical protein JW724_06345 [Candidatus Altiarchaeota archaeon]|nr:hypothetical protein [Candidatus Altiarchaeota archaeon]